MLLAQSGNAATVWLPVAVIFLVSIAFLAVFVLAFRPWIQAFLSGTPIQAFEIVGMRLRRTDVNAVLKTMITAQHAGVTLTCRQVERAALQGVNLEKVTLALIQARKRETPVTWEELVEAELQNRLADKLGRQVGPTSGAEPHGRPTRVCAKCGQPVVGEGKICRTCGAIL